MSRDVKYAGKIRQHVIITNTKYECHRRMWVEGNHFLVGMIMEASVTEFLYLGIKGLARGVTVKG